METNILLENGTNELEILEFIIDGNFYGINVAKIREIIPYQKVTPVPNSHPSIEGIFMPRDIMISVINLPKELGLRESFSTSSDMMIITNFNNLNIAFHVQSVVGIHRVSWADIITPDKTINTNNSSIATGIVKINGRIIIILDFEKIVADINPETSLKVSEIDELGERKRNESTIMIAEDSNLLSTLIVDSLHKSGYVNVIKNENGQEAWDKLCKFKEEGTVLDKVKCIITDIEMPLMDGHRLTKLVKSDEVMQNIPLIIFSSLVNDEMRAKGKSLGADAQLSKPEIGNLVRIIDGLIK
jgi:two-component system chemotaxis response regulator CheV